MKLRSNALIFLTLVSLTFSLKTQEVVDIDHRDTFGISFFHPRSAGSNKARESAGMGNLITWGYDECSHGVSWITGSYARSYNQHGLGQYLFFNGTDTMKTGTAMGPGISIFGENFLVNDNFNGAITARPSVANALVDFNFFYAAEFICNGLYVLAHVPYVSTQWNIDFRETVSTSGTVILANSLGNLVNMPAPFDSMIDAWNGQATFADVSRPLRFARVNGKQKKSGVADVELALGYIVADNECNFISFNIRGIIPTGNRPTGEFFFEPLVGNGHHGELGFGTLSNFYLWEGCHNDFLTIFINANVYTMFGSSREMRTFDLTNNGPGSRYLLFKRFENGVYAGEIVRGPNILTLPVHTKNAIHGDVVLMLEYIRCNFIVDGGYNLWGRTRDHIHLVGSIPENTYGIAGLSGTAANANLTASQTLLDGTNASSLDATTHYISTADINIDSAAHPGAFSHGFFAHIQYIFDLPYVKPFVGLGSEVEFSGTNKSLTMWHFWGKIGLSF